MSSPLHSVRTAVRSAAVQTRNLVKQVRNLLNEIPLFSGNERSSFNDVAPRGTLPLIHNSGMERQSEDFFSGLLNLRLLKRVFFEQFFER